MKTIAAPAGLIPVLPLLALLSGCASLGGLESPELTLVHLQPVEATVFETTLAVRLRIANPNPEPITLEGASFKLTLDDRKVGRGMTPESRRVERFGTEVLEVTFHVSNASVLLRLQEILSSKSVTYGVSGKLYLKQGGSTRKIRIQSEGELEFDSSPTSRDSDSLLPETGPQVPPPPNHR